MIQASPEAGYVYSDEDWIDDDGKLSNEFRKPDWSPERLRHHMYLGHLSALRTDLLREAGGFRAGFGGSRDHDLALRVTEISPTVTHIPEVLYHGRIGPELSIRDTELGHTWRCSRSRSNGRSRASTAHREETGSCQRGSRGEHVQNHENVEAHDKG